MTKCASCGRNTRSENNENSPINGDKYCTECCDVQGNLLPFSEVLENFVNYFMNTLGYDIAVSRNAAMEILKRQPAWEPMFKKEEKMRTKKRVFAIVAGALALVLAVTGVVYGFYRYFGTSRDLFLDSQVQILYLQSGKASFNEMKVNKNIVIKYVVEDKNLVFFSSWNGLNDQDYMFDLEKQEGYCLPTKDGEYSCVFGQEYIWIEKDEYFESIIKRISLNDIILVIHSFKSDTGESSLKEMLNRKSKIYFRLPFYVFSPVIFGKYIIWCDTRNEKLSGLDIYGFNLETQKEFPISTQLGNQNEICIEGKKIYWRDSRNPDSDGYDIYCYDLTTKKEFRINIHNCCSTLFAWKVVDNYLIYSGKDATGLYVMDILTGKTMLVTDKKLSGNEVSTKWDYNTQFYTDKSVLPTLLASTPDSDGDFYIVWEEQTGIKYNSNDFETAFVAYKKMSQISGPTNYIKKTASKDNSQRVESVTNSGITWAEFASNSKNTNRAVVVLTAYRYKGYGEFFRFPDNGALSFYDFSSKENKALEERYMEAAWRKNSAQTKDYIVWTPLNANDEEEINLRYMKIK